MSCDYWRQWDYNYLLSMQGIDVDQQVDDFDIEPQEPKNQEERCPYCLAGCNYCLILNP